jgi:hypothetical protein
VYQYIVEGEAMFDAPASAGAATGADSTVKDGSEADIETDILARISENDSAGGVHVTVRYLPADGVTSDGAEAVYGLSNARVNS